MPRHVARVPCPSQTRNPDRCWSEPKADRIPGRKFLRRLGRHSGLGGRADNELPLWRAMLHRPITRIVYWPFALPPDMAASPDQWLRTNLDQLGVGYQLDTWYDLHQHRHEALSRRQVDLLFVGGGNTFRLLDMVQRAGFIEPVRQFWESGGDYYGGSAGAVLACRTIEIAEGHDPNDVNLVDLTGLGLITDEAILPHFTDSQLVEAQTWARAHRTSVLGLPESVGLQVRDGLATVIGRGHLTTVSGAAVKQISNGDSFGVRIR